MHYTYIAAWAVVGGISIPSDGAPVELFRSDRYRFVLTPNPDIELANLDRGNAVGHLMLKGMFAQSGDADFPTALAAAVEDIKAERTKKIDGHAILIVEANGVVEASVTGPSREHDGFVVAFDVIDKSTLIRTHSHEVESMKLALAFESDPPSRFSTLTEGVYLTDATGRLVYSITFSMSADMSVSSPFTPESTTRICNRFTTLHQISDMDRVQRLFAQMADFKTDRLKAFLSGWAALEILIAKSFKTYEETFLSPLTNAGQPSLRERFLQRVKAVMKDKYRLSDKFLAVAAVLFPDSPDSAVQDDYKTFSRLKDLRDSIYHGDEFVEKDLPVHELAGLLRKYMLAHVETPNPAVNKDAPTSGAPVT